MFIPLIKLLHMFMGVYVVMQIAAAPCLFMCACVFYRGCDSIFFALRDDSDGLKVIRGYVCVNDHKVCAGCYVGKINIIKQTKKGPTFDKV